MIDLAEKIIIIAFCTSAVFGEQSSYDMIWFKL